jgi:hypothetical protein
MGFLGGGQNGSLRGRAVVGHGRWTEFGDGGVEFQAPAIPCAGDR